MRKSSVVACCVTFCLLSAVPENRGAKLLESLSCFRPYPEKGLVCTWTENNVAGKLLNMTLVDTKDPYTSPTNDCYQNKRVTNSSATHSTWTCNVPWGSWVAADQIYFSFVPERKLETRLNGVEERDEAKPQNLRCNSTEGDITCSWLIREEIAESIDFDLFYDDDERECQPRCQQETSKYLSCHCNITSHGHQDTSALLETIIVKPRKPINSTKSYKLCLIYKLPPRKLIIDEVKKGQVFIVTWKNTSPENESFKYKYELCYWNESELKLLKVPDICPADPIKMDSNHSPRIIFLLNNPLKSSSNYSLMVRARLTSPVETYCYRGPWSEWSEVQTLTTKAGRR